MVSFQFSISKWTGRLSMNFDQWPAEYTFKNISSRIAFVTCCVFYRRQVPEDVCMCWYQAEIKN